jgi:hypothetical protein
MRCRTALNSRCKLEEFQGSPEVPEICRQRILDARAAHEKIVRLVGSRRRVNISRSAADLKSRLLCLGYWSGLLAADCGLRYFALCDTQAQ